MKRKGVSRCGSVAELEVLGLVPSNTEGSLAMLLKEKRQDTGVVGWRDSALKDTRTQ